LSFSSREKNACNKKKLSTGRPPKKSYEYNYFFAKKLLNLLKIIDLRRENAMLKGALKATMME